MANQGTKDAEFRLAFSHKETQKLLLRVGTQAPITLSK